MKLCADIQVASSSQEIPSESDIEEWIRATLSQSGRECAELTVRIVDEAEITELNRRYRHRKVPTDVLAFPHQLPREVSPNLIGDVVVCANVINQQADQFRANRQAHWARIIAHGILHLVGYDHDQPQTTLEMEAAEGAILSHLGLHHPELHERLS